MRRSVVTAILVLLAGTFLGGTVFRAPVGYAATALLDVFVTNDTAHPVPVSEQNKDASGNIKVHEQGTANVNVGNFPATQVTRDVNAPGQSPVANTFDLLGANQPTQFREEKVSPDVPAGKRFIATSFSATMLSTNSGSLVTGGDCLLFLVPVNSVFSIAFSGIQGSMVQLENLWSGSDSFFVTLNTGEAIQATCDFTGSQQISTRLQGVLGGYFAPAS